MQTHDNSNHGLREEFLNALRGKADKMGAKGTSSITAGELNEEPICEWKGSNGVHCRKMPDDEHGVLRISIGGGEHVAEDEHLTPHEAANRRAAQFMRNTFDLDIRTNEHWKEFEAQWMNETDDEAPTLEHWLEQWEAAIEAGQSSISREEAEKRYRKAHGRDHGHPNGEG